LINFRLGLSIKVGEVIKTAMRLLGAGVPDRM
jgi:arginyl-tRNA synthetase